jgi:hypothetical protein
MMALVLRVVVVATICALAVPGALRAQDGRRVALVIGNSTYEDLPALANPANDATDIANKLAGLGFEVILGVDVGRDAFQSALLKFAKSIEGAETSLLFYAGHGVQIEDVNYLIPVDARLTVGSDVAGQTIPVDRIVSLMNEYSQTSLIFLDACRNNPLTNQSAGGGQAGVGLARLRAAGGSFIAFATAPDSVAFDGEGRNSPFSAALLAHIDKPNIDIRLMMGDVREEVFQATGQLQMPWDSNSLIGRFYFRQEDSLEALEQGQRDETLAWKAISDSTRREDFAAFLRDFPDGAFAGVAKLKIAALDQIDERESAERADFILARTTNSEEMWQTFIDAYPGGIFAELAREQLEKLRAEIAQNELSLEEIHWRSIRDSRSPGDFRSFLQLYPQGAFSDLAEERMIAAERAQEITESLLGEPTTEDEKSVVLEREAKAKVDRIPTQFIQYGLIALGHQIADVSGVIDAPTRRAIRNYQATIGLPQTGRLSPQEVVDLILAAAALGDSYAMTAAGIMTASGHGLIADPETARLWFDRAADKGNGLAMANLGVLYRDGIGGPRDIPKARSLLTVAVTLGVDGAEPLLRSLDTEVSP